MTAPRKPQTAGMLNIGHGRRDEGLALLREAADAVAGSPWDVGPLGSNLVRAGVDRRDRDLADLGVKLLEAAVTAEPQAPTLRRDLALAYGTLGRPADAEPHLKAAAELAATNADTAAIYATFLRSLNRPAEAERWSQEAARRTAARAKP